MSPTIEVEAAAAAVAGRLSVRFGSSSASHLNMVASALSQLPLLLLSCLCTTYIHCRKSDPSRWSCKMSIFQRNPCHLFFSLSPYVKTELTGPAARTPHPVIPHQADLPLICNSSIQQMAFKCPHLSDT